VRAAIGDTNSSRGLDALPISCYGASAAVSLSDDIGSALLEASADTTIISLLDAGAPAGAVVSFGSSMVSYSNVASGEGGPATAHAVNVSARCSMVGLDVPVAQQQTLLNPLALRIAGASGDEARGAANRLVLVPQGPLLYSVARAVAGSAAAVNRSHVLVQLSSALPLTHGNGASVLATSYSVSAAVEAGQLVHLAFHCEPDAIATAIALRDRVAAPAVVLPSNACGLASSSDQQPLSADPSSEFWVADYVARTRDVLLFDVQRVISQLVNASLPTAAWTPSELVVASSLNTAAQLTFSAAPAAGAAGPAAPVAALTTWLCGPLVRAILLPSASSAHGSNQRVFIGVPTLFTFALVSGLLGAADASSGNAAPTFQPVAAWELAPFGRLPLVSAGSSDTGTLLPTTNGIAQCVMQVRCNAAGAGTAIASSEVAVDATGLAFVPFLLSDADASTCGAWLECGTAAGAVFSDSFAFQAIVPQLQASYTSPRETSSDAVIGTVDAPVPFAATLDVSVVDARTRQSVEAAVAALYFCTLSTTASGVAVFVGAADGSLADASGAVVAINPRTGYATFATPSLVAVEGAVAAPHSVPVVVSCKGATADFEPYSVAALLLVLDIPLVQLQLEWALPADGNARLDVLPVSPTIVRAQLQARAGTVTGAANPASSSSNFLRNGSVWNSLPPQCRLQVLPTGGPTLTPATASEITFELTGSTALAAAPLSSSGLVLEAELAASGAYGASGAVVTVCTIGGFVVSSSSLLVTIRQMVAELAVLTDPGPQIVPQGAVAIVALPSSPGAVIPVLPAPVARFALKASDSGSPEPRPYLSAPDTSCQVTVISGALAVFSGSDDFLTAAILKDSHPAFVWDVTSNSTTLAPLYVQPQWPYWGVTTPLELSCTRRGSEELPQVPWSIVTPNISAAWLTPPPASALSTQPFAAAATLHAWVLDPEQADRALDTSVQLPVSPDVDAVRAFATSIDCVLEGSVGGAHAVISVTAVDGAAALGQGRSVFTLRVAFDAAVISVPRGESQLMTVSCSAGRLPLPLSVSHALQSRMWSRGCPEGQTPSHTSSASSTACFPCPAGTTSTPAKAGSANDTTGGSLQPCFACPRAGVICAPGQAPVLQPGYFPAAHMSWQLTHRTIISQNALVPMPPMPIQLSPGYVLLSCPMRASCLVAADDSTFSCANGYSGPLCAVCVSGYALQGGGCTLCLASGASAALLLLVLTSAVCVGAAVRQAQISGRSNPLVVAALRLFIDATTTLGTVAMASQQSGSGAAVREAVAWLQAVVTAGAGDSLTISPVQCVAGLTLHGRLYTVLLLPCVAVAVMWLMMKAVRACPPGSCPTSATVQHFNEPVAAPSQRHREAEASSAALFLGTVAAFALQPTLIVTAVRAFQCTTEALDGSTFLLADFRIPCEGTQHASARALAAAMLVVSVSFPCFAFVHAARELQRRGAAIVQNGRRKPQPELAARRAGGMRKQAPLRCDRRLPAALEDSYAFLTAGFGHAGGAGEALGCGFMLLRRLGVALAIGLLSDPKLQLSGSAIVLLCWLLASTTVGLYRSRQLAVAEAALLMAALGLTSSLFLA
jgi:hypothetical protein